MRISTIIPAYNCEKYLQRAVESLLATDDSNHEIVIVEDGSTDATLELARELSEKYHAQVRLVTHPDRRNRGVAATRNLGVQVSEGEFIAFLDADDYVFPHRYQSARKILTCSEVDGVYQLCRLEFENEQARHAWWDRRQTFGFETSIDPDRLILELLRGTCWATSAIVVRRSMLARSGLFDPGRKIAEDCHLWFRMAIAGKLVAGDLNQPVSVYWRNGDSAYQPALELRIPMVQAMTSFWTWMLANYPNAPQRKDISRAISEYILNGILSARSSGRHSLAWRLAWESAWDFKPLLKERRWYGQVLRMMAGR